MKQYLAIRQTDDDPILTFYNTVTSTSSLL